MNSARERAVEAGARSDAEFDGRDWNGMSRADRERYLARSRRSLQAIVPVILEEAQEVLFDHTPVCQDTTSDAIADNLGWVEVALRARIQQMAEAEHE
jgi:hypothetical protein